jgi:hypothetical protein
MLLDQFAPEAHFAERHAIDVRCTAEAAYRALWTTDFGASRPVNLLLLLRSLPSVVFASGAVTRRGRSLTLQGIIDGGFGRLAEAPGDEIVLGVAGRFWRPIGNVEPFRREHFTGSLPTGLAKAVWNFKIHRRGAAEPVVVSTETRVVCADQASRRKFGFYWRLIRPFSGMIRVVMLRSIRRTCEGSSGAPVP